MQNMQRLRANQRNSPVRHGNLALLGPKPARPKS
jgi:hypothetical protein